MGDTEAKRHIHPAILARAKELRRPLTPQEHKLWQRLRAKQLCGLINNGGGKVDGISYSGLGVV